MIDLIVGLMISLSEAATIAQTPHHPINIYDGFESSTLSSLWQTDRFTPGSVQMESEVVRAGHSAVRITLHSNDTFEAGRNGDANSERDELREANSLVSRGDTPYEFSWSIYLPADFPVVPVRLVVAQWKQYCPDANASCNDDSPVLAVRYIGGVLQITQDLDHKASVLYKEKRDLRNHWLDLRFRVLFTPKSSGSIKAWLDKKQVVNFTGVTADSETVATGYTNPSHFYFKMGLYRNVMPQPMTIYLDEYRKRELRVDEF